MQIDIRVTEVLTRVVKVNASSVESAVEIVKNMYKNEEIVLDYSDFKGDVLIEKDEEILFKDLT